MPPIGNNDAIIKIHMAKIIPKTLSPPPDFLDRYRTKKPNNTKKVAGIRLKNIQMIISF
jgi:hypothetical protein